MFQTNLNYVYLAIGVALATYITIIKIDNWQLETDNDNLKSVIIGMNAINENEAKEAKEKIVYVDKEIEVIKWRTETRIKTIKEYIRDENLTDCQNALNFARTAF